MSDFSIKNREIYEQKNNTGQYNSEYSKLKSEYLALREKAMRSDLANSPVFIEKQLEVLNNLEVLAKKEQMEDELEALQKEHERLIELNKNNSKSQELPDSYYMPVNIKTFSGQKMQTQEGLSEVFGDEAEYKLEGLIKNAISQQGMTDDMLETILSLASCKIEPDTIFRYANDIIELNAGNCENIYNLEQMISMFSEVLQNQEDTELAKKSIIRLNNDGISPKTINKLMKILSSENEQTKKKTISENDVKFVETIKHNLDSYLAKNLKNEQNKPIYKLNNKISPGEKIIEKEIKDENFEELTEKYNKFITKAKESLIINLVEQGKSGNKDISPNYIRTIGQLNRTGVVYSQIQELMGYCINDKDEINVSGLNAIKNLIASGALSSDITGILNACRTDEQGNYNPDDIQTACGLSSAVIGGKEVSALLKDIRGNTEAKEFFMNFSQIFQDKSNLLKLNELIKDENNNIDSNKIDILYNIEQNLFERGQEQINETEFLEIAQDVLSAAKDDGETAVSDDAAGICAIMCRNRMSIDDIKQGLEICKDKDGKTDEDLAEILWDLCLNYADINQIKETISRCKDEDNNINREYTKLLINNS